MCRFNSRTASACDPTFRSAARPAIARRESRCSRTASRLHRPLIPLRRPTISRPLAESRQSKCSKVRPQFSRALTPPAVQSICSRPGFQTQRAVSSRWRPAATATCAVMPGSATAGTTSAMYSKAMNGVATAFRISTDQAVTPAWTKVTTVPDSGSTPRPRPKTTTHSNSSYKRPTRLPIRLISARPTSTSRPHPTAATGSANSTSSDRITISSS